MQQVRPGGGDSESGPRGLNRRRATSCKSYPMQVSSLIGYQQASAARMCSFPPDHRVSQTSLRHFDIFGGVGSR